MPRHLISDAHEWGNEIPTVPDSTQRTDSQGNGLGKAAGKEDPVELDSNEPVFGRGCVGGGCEPLTFMTVH